MIQSYPTRSGHGGSRPGRPLPNDRERIARARQAAEALFAPKPPVAEKSAPDRERLNDQSDRQPHKPESISPAPIRREAVNAPLNPEPSMMREIPVAHFARIRTWVRYGMTACQVAEVYGVAVGEIERILKRAYRTAAKSGSRYM
jgi:hypothetical protein